MECAACVARLDRALEKLPGVQRAAVNYTAASALITYDEGVTDLAAIAARVKRAGFRVPVEEQDLLPAEADAETAAAAAAALRAVFGVKSVAVQADGTLTAYLWPIGVDGRDLASACAGAGCAVTPGELRGGDADQELEKAHGSAQDARDLGLLHGAAHARDAPEAAVSGRDGAAVRPRAVFLQERVARTAQSHVRHGLSRLALVHAHLSLQRLRDVHAASQLQTLLCVRRGAALAHPLRQIYGAGRGRGGQLRHPQAHAPAAAHGHGPARGHVCRAAGRPDRGARPGAHPSRRARTGRRHGRQRSVRGRRVHAHRREHAGRQSARRQGHRRQPQPLRLGHRLGRGAGQGVRARADHPDRAPGPVRKSTRAALCRQGRALVRAGRHRRGGADVPRLVPARCAAQSRARAAHMLRRAVGRVPVRARPRRARHGRRCGRRLRQPDVAP